MRCAGVLHVASPVPIGVVSEEKIETLGSQPAINVEMGKVV
jgi:hypothetical protein